MDELPYIVSPVPDEGLRLYRLLRSAESRTMLSNFHLARRPRKRERGSALIHMGLSMARSPAPLVDMNRRFGGVLGDVLLTLDLPPEQGIWFAQTGAIWHMTVWSRPEPLFGAIVAEERLSGLRSG